jgi:hypothetical protein
LAANRASGKYNDRVWVLGFMVSPRLEKAFVWTVITLLLLGHLTAYRFLVERISHLPFGYYALLNAIELALFSQILKKVPWKHTEQNSTKMTQ